MKSYITPLLWLLLLHLSSCEKDVLVMPVHEPSLVISGYIYPDSCNIVVSVSEENMPKGYFSLPMMSGDQASVVLYEDGVFFDSLRPFSKLIIASSADDSVRNGYVSLKKTKPGAKYRLEVSCPGYPSVSAETVLPPIVPILSADTVMFSFPSERWVNEDSSVLCTITLCTIDYSFADPAEQNNYYVLEDFQHESSVPEDDYFFFQLQQDLQFDNYLDIYSGEDDGFRYRFFSDKYFQENFIHFRYYFYGIFNESVKGYYVPDDVTARLYTISEEYYKYNQSKLKYMEAEHDPNSEPVIMYSNVTGGYGIFAGISYSEYTYTFAQ